MTARVYVASPHPLPRNNRSSRTVFPMLHRRGKFGDHLDTQRAHGCDFDLWPARQRRGILTHVHSRRTIGNVAGIFGYQGLSTESRYDVAEN